MSNEYHFGPMLQVAKCLRDYLEANDCHPKTPFWHIYVDFAGMLIGKEVQGGERWGLSQSKSKARERLKEAGIDPDTWEIINPKAAAWAWHQLKTTRYFNQKKQREFMSGIHGDPPDISIPFKVIASYEREAVGLKKLDAERTTREQNPVMKHLAAEIRDRLGWD